MENLENQNLRTGKIISQLPDAQKRVIGQTILDGIRTGRFTFNNPLATEGGDYNQTDGPYTQGGGGNHNQGSGGYTQTKLEGNLGRLDITDLSDIMRSIENFERQ